MQTDESLPFHELPEVWQTCFELAWQSHLEGSNPIAAVVADEQGNVVSTGKSAVKAALSGVKSSQCEIAHAEVNALLALDNRVHPKALANTYTIYVSLEPCPLCFSAIYMSDVRKLAFAARDRFGGSTNLLGTTPYLSRKPVEISGPLAELEKVSLFLNVYCDLLRGGDIPDVVHDELAKDAPDAVKLARALAPNDDLGVSRLESFAQVYGRIQSVL